MNQPAKPADQPTLEDAPKIADDQAPNGVPPAADTVAKGVPPNDRQASETAAKPNGK